MGKWVFRSTIYFTSELFGFEWPASCSGRLYSDIRDERRDFGKEVTRKTHGSGNNANVSNHEAHQWIFLQETVFRRNLAPPSSG
jgi:hypothetical protein